MSTAIDTRLSIDTLVQWLPIFGLAAQETWRPSAPRHGTNRTCVEATVRYAFELGYEVAMVKVAAADYSDIEMHAALDVNIQTTPPPL